MPATRQYLTLTLSVLLTASATTAHAENPATPVSYYKQIRPLFQARCLGCHQPAKANGSYVMTEFSKLLAAGKSEKLAVVPGKPAESELLQQITPVDGKALMPKKSKPLHESEIELVSRWIAQGAKDDTPANARFHFDAKHPPVYTRPPVVTALDFAADGALLAVAGFHEVLLVDPDKGTLSARLIGLSERVQSVKFSPNGEQLAVAGGNPGRMGEIQIWNIAKRKLLLSIPLGFDTLYGISWSPNGEIVAVGCPDNTVRAFDIATGEQVLQQGAHSDWVLGTAFSKDGSHLVSIGRDMTTKLTEVATQRFVDNITSITPGALKGGIQAVDRHPQRDEVVVGGSDGTPKVYRLYRQTARSIGDDANLIRKFPAMTGRVFSVAISRDGTRVAAGSALDSTGQVLVVAYEDQDPKAAARIKALESKVEKLRTPQEKAELEKLRTAPPAGAVQLDIPSAGIYAVAFSPDGKIVAAAGSDGLVRMVDANSGKIVKEFSPAPVTPDTTKPALTTAKQRVDYIRDVGPILARLGCNAGTCHGSAQGKNGFKLSLRGYDPVLDVRALTDDLASRRVNVAAPDDSLMLLKSTGAVAHVGSQVVKPDDLYYQILRDWIADGAKLNPTTARVAKIALLPLNPTVDRIEQTQQFHVVATYADGQTRDVTKEAFIESGNPEVATAAPRGGLLTAVRRGEAPILARYEGAYATTTLTVMGDRSGFVWQNPPAYNRIDELTAAKWQRLKIQPSEVCNDVEFLRRVYLDLTGLPPTADDVRAFVADTRDSRAKRDEVVDKLIGSKEYIEFWTNKWADLLQVNRKFLGTEGAAAFRKFIREEVAKNTPYDQLVRKILTANGSNKDNPAASYYKILRDPAPTMENTTHLFLGVRFNCNKCHDHPFERWTQDQYYQMSAYFARVGLKPDPAAGEQKVGGTAVEGAKPLYEVVFERPEGEVKHDRTGAVTAAHFPFPATFTAAPNASRREQLAAWITASDNPYFARSYVNRLWGYLFGIGIIEPIDDIRAGNPPTNPELLDHLGSEFVRSGFDARHILRLICKSRTYQLSIVTNKWNEDDRINFAHATPRRLPAEVMFDTLHRVTGSVSKIPGVPPGTRAAEVPDAGVELPSGFLGAFGRPARESACECERTSGLQLGPVMALVNGQTLADAINDPANEIAKLAAREKDDGKLVQELFLRILNRLPTDTEIAACVAALKTPARDHTKLVAALKAREAEVALLRVQQEKDREAAIERAKTELAAYEKEIAPKVDADEKQRAERIAGAQAVLKKHEDTLPERLAAFEKKQKADVEWVVLEPKTFQATSGAKLSKMADGSVFVEGKNERATYTVTAETDLTGITAIRLEALADERLPKGGPGRSPDGNFVLNQFSVQAKSTKEPGKSQPVALQNARADFTQENFNPAGTIDGTPNNNKGWGVSPHAGLTHWVVYAAKEPAGFAGGTTLSFTFMHQFGTGQHGLGRFRIAVTRAKAPVPLGLAEDYRKILDTPADKRDAKQKATLVRYVKATDAEQARLQRALSEAQQPVPIDPKLKELRDTLQYVLQPVAEDPKLVQLRRDVEYGTKQVGDSRLTGAQDIVWALINSPAFLFNR